MGVRFQGSPWESPTGYHGNSLPLVPMEFPPTGYHDNSLPQDTMGISPHRFPPTDYHDNYFAHVTMGIPSHGNSLHGFLRESRPMESHGICPVRQIIGQIFTHYTLYSHQTTGRDSHGLDGISVRQVIGLFRTRFVHTKQREFESPACFANGNDNIYSTARLCFQVQQ